MKLLLEPTKITPNSKKQMQDLKKFLQKSGVKTEVIETKPKKGELGRGIATGLATVLTGGETIFTKLGDALVKYVEGRRVDLTMKNNKGEELVLSATIPKAEIRSLIDSFFGRNIANKPIKKTTPAKKKATAKKKTATKTSTKKTTTTKSSSKKTTTKKTKPVTKKTTVKKTTKKPTTKKTK